MKMLLLFFLLFISIDSYAQIVFPHIQSGMEAFEESMQNRQNIINSQAQNEYRQEQLNLQYQQEERLRIESEERIAEIRQERELRQLEINLKKRQIAKLNKAKIP